MELRPGPTLVNLIRLTAGEISEAPGRMPADAELAFEAGCFAEVQASARELSRLAGLYYDSARTRNAASVAALRPSFEEGCESFSRLARRRLRR